MKHSNIAPDIEKSNKLYSHIMLRRTDENGESEKKQTQAYKWTIETGLGSFTGTCLSINDLNEEITVLTNNTRIFRKNITPVTLLNETLEDKIYTWNVITNSGQVSGVSVSLEEARKVINSFGYKEIVKSKIIESSAQ